MLWIVLIVLIGLVLAYAMILRPMLKTMPAFSAAFAEEASLVEKLQARVTGWKTIIVARLITIAGLLVEFYDQVLPFVSGQDWTPVTSHLPGWALPVFLMMMGLTFDWLRKVTANPPAVIVQKVDEVSQPVVVGVQQPPKV